MENGPESAHWRTNWRTGNKGSQRAYAANTYALIMPIATVVVTVLLAALFGFASAIKLLGVSQSLKTRDHLGVSPARWREIGLLELAGVIGVLAGLWWAPIGVAAAVGLALVAIGAITFHIRASDRVTDTAPALIGVALAAATAILQAV